MTIKTKLTLITVVAIFTATVLLTISTITSYEEHLNEHIKELKEEAYTIKKEELINYSDMAYRVINSYYQKSLKNKLKTNQLKQDALNAVKIMRYGKNGYFWINNMDNKMLMHPIKPEYDNKYFINTPKVPFVELGTTTLKKLKKDVAFIEYSFYTPATKKYSHKLSIVRLFKPWNWMIGTGVYTDYVDAKIAKAKTKAKKEMREKIINIIVTSFALLLLLAFIMIKLLDKIIIIPLNNFQNGLNKFFKFLEDETVKVEKLTNNSNDEIGLMSQKTNSAIETAVKTHQELLNLRKQLEQKVKITTEDLDKTKQEFNAINQNRKESLEYGALIQASILPDKKLFQNIFNKHFILDIKNDIISSQFYIFEKIKPNEYLYIIMDCKTDGISGVFTTMLTNAIIKQAITQIKYDNTHNVSPAWILEYLNQNIEITKNGFDGAIVYYNQNTHTLKYAGANIPFHYYQDDSFHIVKSNETSIGINKETKYTEHIIDTKEYIEYYISTHHYIKQFIDIYDFTSPFQTNTNQFKEYLDKVNYDVIVAGFQIDNKPQIIINYTGEFTQSLVNKYIEEIEDNIENMGLMSNISTVFVEQFQNILNYGKSKDINITSVTPYGSIKLQKNPDGTYSVETTNILTLADKQKIEPKLFEVESLSRDEIRKKYRALRKSGENTHAKGGGIGFYEIAKRCIKVDHNFTQINEDRFEFRFVAILGKK